MFSIMNPIAPPVQALLELFATELADVHFADVDAKLLARLAADLQASAEAAASAQQALERANAAVLERSEALLEQAQRGLAYARVYAERNEALSARLEAIALPRARRPRAEAPSAAEAPALPRRRGRPRRSENGTLDAFPPPPAE
jgi:hypothetical protein